MTSTHLTLFDLDHTLLPIDSDVAWGEFLCRHEFVDAAAYRQKNESFATAYQEGNLDINEFLEFAFKPLAATDRPTLDRWHDAFMQETILPAVHPAAMDLVKSHRDRGDLIAIVTSTNAFITFPIARLFGIEHLIATIPEQLDGRFTGRCDGEPAFRAAKVNRIERWLNSLGRSLDCFASITAYSDSYNDMPMLHRADVPVATNPDSRLRAAAEQSGWRILELFDDPKIN